VTEEVHPKGVTDERRISGATVGGNANLRPQDEFEIEVDSARNWNIRTEWIGKQPGVKVGAESVTISTKRKRRYVTRGDMIRNEIEIEIRGEVLNLNLELDGFAFICKFPPIDLMFSDNWILR